MSQVRHGLGHQFITLIVDTCVQHGGHESMRRVGLWTAVETCCIYLNSSGQKIIHINAA